MGLAQVYGIVKQHGGHIDVHSSLGDGTTFMIYLPELEQNLELSVVTDIDMEFEGAGETVLVVEDDPAAREAFQALLEAQNYQVLVAGNGLEAVEIYKTHEQQIELIVSDVVMPEMGGIELYRILRRKNPRIKILFISGHPMGVENQRILENHDVHWMQKPFSVQEVSSALKMILGGDS